MLGAVKDTKLTVLLDVDGTIIDSYPGIREGFLRGIDAVGIKRPAEEFIRRIPGPPMRDSMAAAGLSPAQVDRAMEAYSAYMSGEGWQRFEVFDGMAELIARWKGQGVGVCTATSKSERFARLALERAGILEHIDFLGAANHDVGRSTKIEVLDYVMTKHAPARAVMVGDRTHDFGGAAEFGLPSVAVTWGYGTEEEWAQATHTAHTARELEEIINEYR